MYAQKTILHTDKTGKPVKWPDLPPNAHFEVIFLELSAEEAPEKPCESKRQPHPDIAGKLRLSEDIMDTVPQEQWDLPA